MHANIYIYTHKRMQVVDFILQLLFADAYACVCIHTYIHTYIHIHAGYGFNLAAAFPGWIWYTYIYIYIYTHTQVMDSILQLLFPDEYIEIEEEVVGGRRRGYSGSQRRLLETKQVLLQHWFNKGTQVRCTLITCNRDLAVAVLTVRPAVCVCILCVVYVCEIKRALFHTYIHIHYIYIYIYTHRLRSPCMTQHWIKKWLVRTRAYIHTYIHAGVGAAVWFQSWPDNERSIEWSAEICSRRPQLRRPAVGPGCDHGDSADHHNHSVCNNDACTCNNSCSNNSCSRRYHACTDLSIELKPFLQCPGMPNRMCVCVCVCVNMRLCIPLSTKTR
jgi:hypothetical protein